MVFLHGPVRDRAYRMWWPATTQITWFHASFTFKFLLLVKLPQIAQTHTHTLRVLPNKSPYLGLLLLTATTTTSINHHHLNINCTPWWIMFMRRLQWPYFLPHWKLLYFCYFLYTNQISFCLCIVFHSEWLNSYLNYLFIIHEPPTMHISIAINVLNSLHLL